MSERLSTDDVAQVASLARLRLTQEELEMFTDQLAAVLDVAGDLEAIDLGDVEPMAHPYPLKNVTRADEIRPSIDREAVLAEAPQAEDGRFRVPPALGESQ